MSGAAIAFQPGKRYWVHAIWVLDLLFLLSIQWWFFWSYSDVEWNYARFMLALSPLCILYVIATLLVPSDTAAVVSWRDHFFEVRFRIRGLALVLLVAMVLNTVIQLGHPVLHPRRILPGSLAVLFIAGLVSDHPKVQATVALGVFALTIVAAMTFLGAGSFGVAP